MLRNNNPIEADTFTCVTTTEATPPEGSILCGADPGEPGYFGFGVLRANLNYSTPAVPGSTKTTIAPGARLFDPERGFIRPRNFLTGQGGLRKPTVGRSAQGVPLYRVNSTANLAADPAALTPSNENDYIRGNTFAQKQAARQAAITLGKAFFWDMQVGRDGVQACGTCHFTGAGTYTRTKNQLNPNHLGGDLTLQLHGPTANQEVTLEDFPLHKLTNPDIAGDPACTTPLLASVNAGVLENNFPGGVTDLPVCDAANIVSDVNDVMSSMGVIFGTFADIPTPGGGPLFPGIGCRAAERKKGHWESKGQDFGHQAERSKGLQKPKGKVELQPRL